MNADAVMRRSAELLAIADAERDELLADIAARQAQIEMEAATTPQPTPVDWTQHQRALERMAAAAAAASTPRPPPPPPQPPPPPIDWRAWGEAIAQLVAEDIASATAKLQRQVDALGDQVRQVRAEIQVRSEVQALRDELEQLRQERAKALRVVS